MTRDLTPPELAKFRDAWVHQSACAFTASIDELMSWDEQLWHAIQRGELDPRASWEIKEDEAAQRMASLIAEKLAALLTVSRSSAPGNDTDGPAPSPEAGNDTGTPASSPEPGNDTGAPTGESPDRACVELLRAADVRMTSREWRAAIRRGDLRASKVGREYLATRGDYEAFLEAKRVAASSGSLRRKRDGDQASTAVERALASGRLLAIPGGRRR